MPRYFSNNKQRAIAQAMGQYRAKEFKEITDKLVPCVYAAVGMALMEKGWRFKRINDLFKRSQEIWEDKCWEDGSMVDRFEEMSGIEIRKK